MQKEAGSLPAASSVSAELDLISVNVDTALKDRVFNELRRAILGMDIYTSGAPPKLDERTLASALGVSRTPVREALSRLEQEGLVHNIPRRGMFVVRKSKQEIVEIIEVWAALESMAARLAVGSASDQAMAEFKAASVAISQGTGDAVMPIDEYSGNNIDFHQSIIALSGNATLVTAARRLFDHMHAIRASTIRDAQRRVQSVIDHGLIVDALVERRAARAERLVREHALNLARHVERNVDYLE